MSRTLSSISLLLAVVLLWTLARFAVAESPLVDDQAGLLSDEQRDSIALQHAFLLTDFDIDYRLITVRNAGDIIRFGADQFQALDAGGLSSERRGLLLVIDPAQDRVRLEAGHALEGVYTDAFTSYIEQRQMVPFFQAERIADGILATTEMIVAQAQEATARSGFEVVPGVSGSGGAGATAPARIGQRTEPVDHQDRPAVPTGASPAETLDAYFDAMRSRDGRAQLDLYTVATQQMLKDWVMTPAQMDNVLRTYSPCTPESALVSPDGLYAVIRYTPSQRQCSPWFLALEHEKWKLDFTIMQEAIRFGRDNSWRFASGLPEDYEFAFGDWAFDRNGFPIAR